MVKAIDILNDSLLINHWVRRFIAYIIDYILIVILLVILRTIINLSFLTKGIIPFLGFFGIFGFSWLSAAIWLLYTTLMEGTQNATFGKRFLNLRVEHHSGRIELKDALFRNLSKVSALLLILDLLIGFVTDGDPRERFLDRFSGTIVVRTDLNERFPPGPSPSEYYKRPMPHPPRPRPRTQAYRR